MAVLSCGLPSVLASVLASMLVSELTSILTATPPSWPVWSWVRPLAVQASKLSSQRDGTAIDGGVKAASAADDDLSVGATMDDAGSAETNKIAPESSGGAGVEVVVGTDVSAALGAGVGAGVGAACGSGVCGAVVVDVGANVDDDAAGDSDIGDAVGGRTKAPGRLQPTVTPSPS